MILTCIAETPYETNLDSHEQHIKFLTCYTLSVFIIFLTFVHLIWLKMTCVRKDELFGFGFSTLPDGEE